MKLHPSTSYFGEVFEHWVILECIRLESYLRRGFQIYYYRNFDGQEIDLVLEAPGQKPFLIEIKPTECVSHENLSRFQNARKHLPEHAVPYCLSRDPVSKGFSGIRAVPWQLGLQEIFQLRA